MAVSLFGFMNTRRKFLVDFSTALAALALAPMRLISAPLISGGGWRALEQMSYSSLAEQINTMFQVRLSSTRVVKLRLLKAPLAPSTRHAPSGRPPGDAGNEKFSLIFNGPKGDLIEPAIHQFEHERLGRFEMYIGGIGARDGDSVRYETVFNRAAPATSARVESI
jgi:hypothetical protein